MTSEKKNLTLTRQALYDLVWSNPVRTVAQELGISDVALAKTCRRAHIPLPNRGHWAKRQAGKPTFQPPLPIRGLGEADEIQFGRGNRWYWHETDQEILSAPLPPAPSFSEGLVEVTARATQLVGRVPLPANLSQRVHPLIATLLRDDEERREKQKNSPSPFSWDNPRFESPFERRRLRILNALFLALTRCGCRPSLRAKEMLEPGVCVGDQHLSFELEPIKLAGRRTERPLRAHHDAKEKLRLAINWHRPAPEICLSWQDEGDTPLEKQLASIAAGLLIAGEWAYRGAQQHRYEWRVERKQELELRIQQEREEAARQERARALKLEKKRRDHLFATVTAWKQASELRAFVQAVRERHVSATDHADLNRIDRWALWALAEADRLDPLCDTSAFLDQPQQSH